MVENKRLAGSEGMIFWTYTGIVVSYFAMSYFSDVFRSVIIDNQTLSNFQFLAPYISDVQSLSVLVAGLILTAALAFQAKPAGALGKVLNYLPLVLFAIPGLTFFAYAKCRYQIGGPCDAGSEMAFDLVYYGSLLVLGLIIGLILTRAPIPARAFKYALIPLAIVALATFYSMIFAVSWGLASLNLTDSVASNLFFLGGKPSNIPGGWRIWVQTGIVLQILFAALAVLGLVQALFASTRKPAVEAPKKKRSPAK